MSRGLPNSGSVNKTNPLVKHGLGNKAKVHMFSWDKFVYMFNTAFSLFKTELKIHDLFFMTARGRFGHS